jgi:regulator of cell morphogenesis and NO signaling
MKIQVGEKVSRIAVENPATVKVLEHFGIRFYDSKPETLASACTRAGVPLESVLEGLRQAAASPSIDAERWDFAPLPALVRFILDNHHTWERNQVAVIQKQIDVVHAEVGGQYPELTKLQLLFGGMSKGFLVHMKHEENDLFPSFLHEVAPGAARTQQAKKAHELLPLTVHLTKDHDVLLTQWDAMRSLTGNFHPPMEAKDSHRELLRSLSELESYQHQHIHKENFILFEKIRQLALKR